MCQRVFASLAAGTLACTICSAQTQPYMEWLGHLPGALASRERSQPRGVSADGSVVVGQAQNANGEWEAFRWTKATGMVGLGSLRRDLVSVANAVSADGSTIIGDSQSPFATEAFRWTESGAMVGLGQLAGNSSSWAADVSGDGSVIVGGSNDGGFPNIGSEAFHWTQVGGMVGLGELPGGNTSSLAVTVSADGATLFGHSDSSLGWETFKWTNTSGMLGLGYTNGNVQEVSSDGSTLVGWKATPSAPNGEAYYWNDVRGLVMLGDLPGGNFQSSAWGVSGDASIIVGKGVTAVQNEAMIWDAINGMRRLEDVLLGLGIVGPSVELDLATAVSPDGRYIVGFGYPTGPFTSSEQAFLAFLGGGCYADCDTSTGPGVLDVFDFLCFQNSFVAGEPYGCDCDTSTGAGVCDVFDFLCFQDAFVGGCP